MTQNRNRTKSSIKYAEDDIEHVFQVLISNCDELIAYYSAEIKSEDDDSRLPYIDMSAVSSFLLERLRLKQTKEFGRFFENVEEVYVHGDQYVKDLIVAGLFEGIQNPGGPEIDYYRSFDKWLKPKSLKAWRDLIDFWEGSDWKKTEESERILNSKRKK